MTYEQALQTIWDRCQHCEETEKAFKVLERLGQMNNDLISRSALKEAFKEAYAGITFSLIECNDLIDNAPTVEAFTKEDMAGAYNEGYACGNRESERPKGEWIWLGDNPNPNHKWSCNKCGRGVKEQENFCPNCGADMRGEEKC